MEQEDTPKRLKCLIIEMDTEASIRVDGYVRYCEYLVDNLGKVIDNTFSYSTYPFFNHDSYNRIASVFEKHSPMDRNTICSIIGASYYVNSQGKACGKCITKGCCYYTDTETRRYYTLTFNLTDDSVLDGDVEILYNSSNLTDSK